MKLPIVSGKKIVTALKKLGFYEKRQRGDHLILRKDTPSKVVVVVPLHKTVAPGTLLSILRKAHLTRKQLIRFLKKKS